jgi:hypothetical protein
MRVRGAKWLCCPSGSVPVDDVDAIGLHLSELSLRRLHQWGACWLALSPYKRLAYLPMLSTAEPMQGGVPAHVGRSPQRSNDEVRRLRRHAAGSTPAFVLPSRASWTRTRRPHHSNSQQGVLPFPLAVAAQTYSIEAHPAPRARHQLPPVRYLVLLDSGAQGGRLP